MACRPGQDYFQTLKTVEKSRYVEKLGLIHGFDPYTDTGVEWKQDADLLPAVSYPDIVNYLVFSPSAYSLDSLKAYKSMDAYNHFVCGWVRNVFIVVKHGSHIVKCKVLHSQSVREKPLSPWIIAKQDGTVLAAHCDCKAGLGEACSHIGALLFYIEACIRIRDSKTVTDEKAYWMLPGSFEKVEYLPIKESDFTSAKGKRQILNGAINSANGLEACKSPRLLRIATTCKDTPETTEQELVDFFKEISMSGGKPAILSVVSQYSDAYVPKPVDPSYPKPLTDLYDESCVSMKYNEILQRCETVQLQITEQQAKNVEKSTRCQANNKLWFKYRAGRITASRFKAVCHSPPAQPSQSLVKAICNPEAAKFTTAATSWRCHHEKTARKQYEKMMSQTQQNFSISDSGLIINPGFPHLGASPDGIIKCDCCGVGCLEIKCPFCRKNDFLSDEKGAQVSFLEQKGDTLTLNTNHAYYYQIQCQMNLGDFEFSDFVAWTELDMHVQRVESDPIFFAEKVAIANDFFKLAILPELLGKFYSRPPKCPLQPVQMSVVQPQADDEFEVWCLCRKGLDSNLIACDNENCVIQWFHFECVGVKTKPRGKWYCPDCRLLQQFKRRRLNKSKEHC